MQKKMFEYVRKWPVLRCISAIDMREMCLFFHQERYMTGILPETKETTSYRKLHDRTG